MWARNSVTLGLLGSVLAASAAGPPAPKAPAKLPPAPRGPVAVYDIACLRCHGPEGVNYGPTFGKALTDKVLRQAVVDMKDGKGNIELTETEIDAQTAYHRAIILREPFVAVTVATRERLAGECSEDAVVSVTVDGKPVNVRRNGYRWDCSVKPGKREVVAKLGNRTTRLNPDIETFSHRNPLPDPKP